MIDNTDNTDTAKTEIEFLARVRDLIYKVDFRDYGLFVKSSSAHSGIVMQGCYKEACAVERGEDVLQYTRKWVLSPDMTDSEIVLTAFKLCLTSMEHRTREFFTYKGQRICSPHLDVEDLVTLCRSGRADAGARP